MTSLSDVKLFSLKTFIEPDGNLVPIENSDIPFNIKRMFYVFGVKDQNDRGRHSHHTTKQVLICLQGEVKVNCDDGRNRKQWILDDPTQALYIPEMIWDEQIYTSEDSILLVLANTKYNIKDYIEDYENFKEIKYEEKRK
jgi:dTDP-4-dehydrorhamnose 3,5-epimerase-like enzyme